jgi:hypothetical protein
MCLNVSGFFVMSVEYGNRRVPKYPASGLNETPA